MESQMNAYSTVPNVSTEKFGKAMLQKVRLQTVLENLQTDWALLKRSHFSTMAFTL